MTLKYRCAKTSDLAQLVNMLADDPLGSQREQAELPLLDSYVDAFKHIEQDPNNELIVAESDQHIVGMMQLTFIPYLTYKGSWRCLIEGVRIHKAYRGQGLGKQFFEWAIRHAKNRGCHLLQLTSDKQRPEAIRFYESLGFVASHEGFKLPLLSQ
jgi:GNAT superfamily N-acetyltransferase